MNKPGSFKRDINWSGWGVAIACAAGVAELALKLVPLLPRLI